MSAVPMRLLSPIVFVALVVFASAGFLHDFIPHEHGHDSPFAAAVWQNIHATLGHEEKHAPDTRAVVYEYSDVDMDASIQRFTISAELSPLKHETLLRRGVFAYRRFG